MLNAIRAFLIWSAIIMRQLTWPGSFFRELAHQLACYAAGHKVLEVRYIIRNDPNSVVGYVRHRGPPGMGRELFIGIAPLFLGLAIWAGYIGVAVYLTRDGSLGLMDTLIVVAATLVTANATYHALPSPQDMENVFQQPFSLLSLPCYVIAGPVWVVGHNLPLGPLGMDPVARGGRPRHHLRSLQRGGGQPAAGFARSAPSCVMTRERPPGERTASR